MLLGNVPLPTGVNEVKAKNAVDRAADEIDSAIGFKYQTPIVGTGPQGRAVRLLMQNISIWLSSGRLIEELTASTQRVEEHAYARSLIQQAWMVLNKIISGEIILDGVPVTGGTEVAFYGPVIANKDTESNVDAFYDRVSNPLAAVGAVPDDFYLERLFGGNW
jgi:phage gp36-like protein